MPGPERSDRRSVGRVASELSHGSSEPLVAPSTRRTMQGNIRRDTAPELALRRLLHASGLRFRVDHPLPFDRRRRADVVFTRVNLYIYVDGCFWHGCPTHYVPPRTRSEFWREKVARNRMRDEDTNARLREAGCGVLRLWEHVPPAVAAEQAIVAYRAALLENSRSMSGFQKE